MRSLNSPLWGSMWQAVQVLSSKWNGRILSVLPPRPALWHSAQATATWAPVSTKRVFLCLAMVNVERWKSFTVWQSSQRFW